MFNTHVREALPRITGKLMASFRDKPATLVGDVVKVDPEGKRFTLKTTDNCFVQVVLSQPVSGHIDTNCLTECFGVVQNANVFNCNNFIQFPQDASEKFDRTFYNDFVGEFIKQHEKHFNIERPEDHEGPVINPNDNFQLPTLEDDGA